jgi:hypothetical protein
MRWSGLKESEKEAKHKAKALFAAVFLFVEDRKKKGHTEKKGK